jgi:hypothetical protein
MKKILFSAAIGFVLMGCGGAANDGDPTTDTSTMPSPDTGMMAPTGDSASMINSNTGSYPSDTAGSMKKPDTRSSTSAYKDGKGGTARDTSKQQ